MVVVGGGRPLQRGRLGPLGISSFDDSPGTVILGTKCAGRLHGEWIGSTLMGTKVGSIGGLCRLSVGDGRNEDGPGVTGELGPRSNCAMVTVGLGFDLANGLGNEVELISGVSISEKM